MSYKVFARSMFVAMLVACALAKQPEAFILAGAMWTGLELIG